MKSGIGAFKLIRIEGKKIVDGYIQLKGYSAQGITGNYLILICCLMLFGNILYGNIKVCQLAEGHISFSNDNGLYESDGDQTGLIILEGDHILFFIIGQSLCRKIRLYASLRKLQSAGNLLFGICIHYLGCQDIELRARSSHKSYLKPSAGIVSFDSLVKKLLNILLGSEIDHVIAHLDGIRRSKGLPESCPHHILRGSQRLFMRRHLARKYVLRLYPGFHFHKSHSGILCSHISTRFKKEGFCFPLT